MLGSRSEETLVALFALVAMLYFFYWLLEYARGRVMARVGARVQAEPAGPLVRAQGMAPQMTERWIQQAGAAADETLSATDWTGSFASFTRAFRLFLQSAMLTVGAYLVLQNQMTAGAMIAASILLGRALAPIEAALSGWPMVQRARAGWRDLGALLAAQPEERALTELPAPAARLDVKGVTLVLSRGEKPILHQVGFDVAPGEALGVIGKNRL